MKCLGGVSDIIILIILLFQLFSDMSEFSSCLLSTCLLVVGQREVTKHCLWANVKLILYPEPS